MYPPRKAAVFSQGWLQGSVQAWPRRATRRGSPARHRARRQPCIQAGIGDIAGLVVFSALPFVAVQALADSPWGKQLQENLEQQKGKLQGRVDQWLRERETARQQSRWYGPQRPRWLGPIPYEYPEHLQGDLPGDYGYDPLSLGKDRPTLDRYFELELLHARWAMLAALGALLPEALQLAGVTEFLEPVWWRVGYAKIQGEDLNYLGVAGLRVAGGQGVAIIALCQVLLMFGPEYARSRGIQALEPLGVYLPGDKNYPGGWLFDPLGVSQDGGRFEELRVKEIKNGRVAMVAWLGFSAQAAATGKGPVENLVDAARPWLG